jgi:conjugative transfer pilus assembly protein TraH
MKNLKQAMWAIALTLIASTATADLDDALQSMYVVTGNEPNIYQSQRRLGIDAGYLRLRAPVNTFNVVNFSPPRFDVGCGGLDLYGGSFSFINAEQFRQLLRQIGANALGYAFKLALSSICADCEAQLTQLMNDIAEKTQMQVDSCKWAQGLVEDSAKALGFKFEQEHSMEEAAQGTFGDTWEAIQSMFDDPHTDKSGLEADGANSTDPEVGNYTWNALTITATGNRFTFAAGNITHNELLMNIAGSFNLRAPKTTEIEEGDVNDFQSARMSYHEFKTGKEEEGGTTNDAFPLVRCVDQVECIDLAIVGAWSFDQGVTGWVEQQLQAAADHMASPVTASAAHAVALQNFLASLPYTVMRHMMVMQGDGASLDQYVQIMKEPISRIYASHLAIQMVQAVRLAYEDSETPDIPKNVAENLAKFEFEALEDRRMASGEYADVWLTAEEFVALHRRSYGDPGLTVKSYQQ